jgi:hypothetical protein
VNKPGLAGFIPFREPELQDPVGDRVIGTISFPKYCGGDVLIRDECSLKIARMLLDAIEKELEARAAAEEPRDLSPFARIATGTCAEPKAADIPPAQESVEPKTTTPIPNGMWDPAEDVVFDGSPSANHSLERYRKLFPFSNRSDMSVRSRYYALEKKRLRIESGVPSCPSV